MPAFVGQGNGFVLGLGDFIVHVSHDHLLVDGGRHFLFLFAEGAAYARFAGYDRSIFRGLELGDDPGQVLFLLGLARRHFHFEEGEFFLPAIELIDLDFHLIFENRSLSTNQANGTDP